MTEGVWTPWGFATKAPSGGGMTPEQASKSLDAFAKDIDLATPRSMNKVRKVAIADAKRGFKSENPGRTIFASKGGRYKLKLTVTGRTARYSNSQKAYVTTVTMAGMAGLIEAGGKTKPPREGKIYPVRKEALKFNMAGGTVYADSVEHPGARVPKNPIGQKAVEKAFVALPKEIDEAIAAAVRARGLA